MSAIDNAFIRAYTAEKTPAAAATGGNMSVLTPVPSAQLKGAPAVAARPVPAPVAPMSLAAARAARAATATEAEQIPQTPTAPAPHFNPAAFSAAISTPQSPVEPLDEPAAFRVDSVDSPAAEEPALPPRAAYEVDRFEWPALCDTLQAQLAGGLDHLAGELVTESALGRKVIAITSLRRGEGRTTLALALARRLAAGGAKVLLVDADFESPQTAAQLGLDIEQGWDEAAADGATAWDTMVESLADQLTVLPLAARRGSALRRRATGEGSHSARGRYEPLRSHFDLVLIDAGPLDTAAGSGRTDRLPASLAGCDAALLVCDARETKPAALADAQRRLLDASVTPLGVVENFCQAN